MLNFGAAPRGHRAPSSPGRGKTASTSPSTSPQQVCSREMGRKGDRVERQGRRGRGADTRKVRGRRERIE